MVSGKKKPKLETILDGLLIYGRPLVMSSKPRFRKYDVEYGSSVHNMIIIVNKDNPNSSDNATN